MGKYNLNKMLEVWGGSSVTGGNPFPNTDDSEDVEDLTSDEVDVPNMTTNIPTSSDPENIPGPDNKKFMKEADAPDKLVPPKPKAPATPPTTKPVVPGSMPSPATSAAGS